MAGAALGVEKVEVAYGAVTVLHAASLEVAAGEFVALLGSSGCGKTTLLRAISGFVPIAAGRITVAGKDITALPPERRDMAMVFQSYALWPHMTAAQNVAYGLKLRGIGRAERAQRVEEVLALLGLKGLGERPIAQLSGGQRQRVALGRALAVNPPILLLDEPMSNLDARIRQSVRHEIRALQQQLGITAIHVTHDREEAMVMADRIAIMNAGVIAQYGTPEEVYRRPASPFVAAFMGAENRLPLKLARAQGAIEIAAGPHNAAARLALPDAGAAHGLHLASSFSGNGAASDALALFRSEAARLGAPDERPGDSLVLRGEIVQRSYPGGTYRYEVAVGDAHFLVDEERRLAVGDPVAVVLPAAALHLYPA